MRVHEDFGIPGENQVTDLSSADLNFLPKTGDVIAGSPENPNFLKRTVKYAVDSMKSDDPTALQKMIRFAVGGVVKTREQILRFGNFAIPMIVAYNAGKVFLATQYGEPVMDFLNLDAETQKAFMESSIPIVLGTSKTLYAGIWITAEKVRDTLNERGGPSSVLNEFVSDERS